MFVKSFDELQRFEQQVMDDFNAELDQAQKVFDLTSAALRQDAEVLRKLDSADQTLAKAAADRLLADNRGSVAIAKADAINIGMTAVRDALLKRNQRLFSLNALSKRSARHLAAMANRS
jgi:hypothetical protein